MKTHSHNFYLRVEAMQCEYLKHHNSGRTEMHIYRKFIYPQFFISRSTFYTWLTINARKELEKLNTPQTATITNQ